MKEPPDTLISEESAGITGELLPQRKKDSRAKDDPGGKAVIY